MIDENNSTQFQQSAAGNLFLDAMHKFYEHLSHNDMRLFMHFAESGLEFESEYSDDHYYQTDEGHYDGAGYPLPVIEVMDACDIFINDGSIDFYAYLDEPLPPETLRRYNIFDSAKIDDFSNLYLFKMSDEEDGEVVVAFAKKLKNLRSSSCTEAKNENSKTV